MAFNRGLTPPARLFLFLGVSPLFLLLCFLLPAALDKWIKDTNDLCELPEGN